MSSNDFSPGLAGVVAFETEIAEPDKDGGELRYRGINIEDLRRQGAVRARVGAARRRVPVSEPLPYEHVVSAAPRAATPRPPVAVSRR